MCFRATGVVLRPVKRVRRYQICAILMALGYKPPVYLASGSRDEQLTFRHQNPCAMRTFLPFLFLLPLATNAQTILISQDFDSFSNGALLAQTAGLPWSTWSNAPGGAEDTPISDEQAHSGTLSAKFSSATVQGGPTDISLRLGNRTAGQFTLGWWMYVPAGNGAYFNLQKNEIIGAGSWAFEITFRANGALELSTNALAGPTTTYPSDEWFEVIMVFDMDNTTAALSLNGGVVATWATNTLATGGAGPNQLGGVNIYAYGGGDLPLWYIDDVNFVQITGAAIAETDAPAAKVFPNPTTGPVTVDLAGMSPTARITVLDATGREVLPAWVMARPGIATRMELDLSGSPEGLYFLRIQDEARDVVQRIVKL